LGRQPDFEVPAGQKGGNGPNRRPLPRPRKRLHSALAQTKHRVHSATRQRQRQRKAKANSICQGAPRQPASRASSGWKQSRRFGSRSQEVRQKEDAQSGRAGCWPLAMPLSPSCGFARAVSIRTNCASAPGTSNRFWLRRARRSNSRSGRRAPLGVASRFAGTRISGVLGCVCFEGLSRGSQLACLCCVVGGGRHAERFSPVLCITDLTIPQRCCQGGTIPTRHATEPVSRLGQVCL
jgi:hypothetical protein